MKSYKNKRVRSRRNKSRRYSRKRKGGEIQIDATKDYKIFKYPGCDDFKKKVKMIVESNPTEKTFTFSNKAQDQITKCNRNNEGASTYRDEIENMIINNQQSYDIETPMKNAPQYQVISPEQFAEAKRQLAEEAEAHAQKLEQEAKARARADLAQARNKVGQPLVLEPSEFSQFTTALGEIPVGERKPELMAGPYNGGKKRRHRRKSRKHSRRH